MNKEESEKKHNTLSNESFIMKPKVDFCFKELMADDEIRRGFISALLTVKPEEILHTELLPTHLRKDYQEDKLGILDVRVQVLGRGQMDIEIQIKLVEIYLCIVLFLVLVLFHILKPVYPVLYHLHLPM